MIASVVREPVITSVARLNRMQKTSNHSTRRLIRTPKMMMVSR
jgi:hypothetical protein